MTWIRLKWLRLNAVSQEKLILYALNSNYLPQTKFAKVMFLQVSVCPRGVACVVGGVHGRRACVAGGHAWQGGVCGRGACVVGTCMAGGYAGFGGMRGRYYDIWSMSGQYASYWNAFLL